MEDGQEAVAGHLGVDVDACGFEEGWGEVHEVDKVVNRSAWGDDAFPHGGQGHVVGDFVELAFHAGEGHAVVGSDHDEGVVEFAALFEGVEDVA